MSLKTMEAVYPSGMVYTNVYVDDLLVGSFHHVDGGYMFSNGRKLFATTAEAETECLRRFLAQWKRRVKRELLQAHAVKAVLDQRTKGK